MAKGRKDKNGQEVVIRLETAGTRVPELIKLYKAAEAAGADLNDAVKKAAEDSGLLASVVRKFVCACAGENYEKEKQKSDQLSLLFEEVGEVSTS
jgi:hypothetical protein